MKIFEMKPARKKIEKADVEKKLLSPPVLQMVGDMHV
jgi:hypothetical protein